MSVENYEAKIRHLEMIQAVISRMANNSFMLKGWAVTLVAGVFALSANDANEIFFLIAYVPVVLFWFLDSYYLQLERKFKVLYNKIGDCEEPDFTFSITAPQSCESEKTKYAQSLFSITEFGFYFPTAVLVSAIIIISTIF
jgi:hypothetical protein